MRNGPLRHRVTLQTQTTSQSATGAITRTWADAATVWAQMTPMSGKQFFEAATNQEEIYTRFIIKWGANVSGCDTTWRVKYGTRYFDIRGVHNSDERDRMLILSCVEGEADNE